ncbi:hypothetical protein HDV00_011605 [Rhizophlyctis rosea]|nr:hypothetical protein HDV00_011605 [Rhizophlyctis rosea]
MLEEHWMESGREEVEVDIADGNIQTESVELVLARLYGNFDTAMSPSLAPSHLAAALFFHDEDLAIQATSYILSTISRKTILPYFLFADSNYYGAHSERILDACLEMLCRDGVRRNMVKVFAGLPWEWCERILGSDCLWCESEVERAAFVAMVVRERLGVAYHGSVFGIAQNGVVRDDMSGKRRGSEGEDSESENESDYEDASAVGEDSDKEDCSEVLSQCLSSLSIDAPAKKEYTNILSHAPLYTHMSYADIRRLKESLAGLYTSEGVRVDPSILKRALWDAQDLKYRIQTANESDEVLNLDGSESDSTEYQSDEEDEEKDTSFYNRTKKHNRITLPPNTDTEKIDSQRLHPLLTRNTIPYPHIHSRHPPFRAGVEFTNLPSLLRGARMVSRTLEYAGSHWQIYLQTDAQERDGRAPSKLGIYLQRVPPAAASQGQQQQQQQQSSTFTDPRTAPHVYFTLQCYFPGKCYFLESKPDTFKMGQSWGWRSGKMFRDAFGEDDVREGRRRWKDRLDGDGSALRVAVVMGVV